MKWCHGMDIVRDTERNGRAFLQIVVGDSLPHIRDLTWYGTCRAQTNGWSNISHQMCLRQVWTMMVLELTSMLLAYVSVLSCVVSIHMISPIIGIAASSIREGLWSSIGSLICVDQMWQMAPGCVRCGMKSIPHIAHAQTPIRFPRHILAYMDAIYTVLHVWAW